MKIHVVHVIQEYFPALGGGPLAVHLRAMELSKYGIKNTVLTTNLINTKKNITIRPGQYSDGEITVYRLRALNFNSNYIVVPEILSYLLFLDYDIIHVYGYGYFSTEVAALASRLRNKPMVFSPCGYFPLTMKVNRYITKFYGLISKMNSLKKANYIFVDSMDDFQIYSTLAKEEKLKIIPGPTLKKEVVAQNVSACKFLEKYNIDYPYFFSLGRITETKGISNLHQYFLL